LSTRNENADKTQMLQEVRGSLRSSYSVAGSQVLKIVIQFVSVLALTRLFSPEDFGTLALASLAVLVIELVRDQGLTSVLLSSPDVSREQIRLLGQRQILIALSGMVVMALAGLLLEMQGSYAGALYVFTLMGLLPVFSALQMPCIVQLTDAGRFRIQNVADVLSYSAGFGFALALALSGFGLIALVVQPLLSAFLSMVIRFAFSPWRVFSARTVVETQHLQQKGRKVFASNILNLSAAYTDSLAIAIQYSTFQLGGYNRLYQIIVGSASQLITSLGPLILSAFGKLKSDSKAMIKFSDFFIYRLGIPSAILAGLSTPHSKTLVTLFFGAQWGTFSTIFLLLAFAAVFQVLTYVATWLSTALLSGKEILRTTAIAKIPSVVAVVLSSFLGPEAVALTLAATQILTWLVFSFRNANALNSKVFQVLRSGLVVIVTLALTAAISSWASNI
jgi:O-antigen/teichoic acid export membrane protein